MNDVRDQLIHAVQRTYAAWSERACADVADAILARWTLTEKPVVTAEELGKMVDKASGCCHGLIYQTSGKRMFDQLASAGLTIVRIEEAGK